MKQRIKENQRWKIFHSTDTYNKTFTVKPHTGHWVIVFHFDSLFFRFNYVSVGFWIYAVAVVVAGRSNGSSLRSTLHVWAISTLFRQFDNNINHVIIH